MNDRSLYDEIISNKFYIHISVVGIIWIYLFGSFILSLIHVYSMGCDLSSVF